MTSEATPFRRQPAGQADRRLRARLLPRHPRRRGRHRGGSGAVPRRCFDWNGPRPWSGQTPAQAAAMRAAYEAGWRAGVDRGRMLSAVCGAINDPR